jgi:Cdc6-like AAA superfamily ATPase
MNYTIASFEELQELKMLVGTVFKPATPITIRELFAGRWNQIQTLADAVNQSGLHVAIYGERGVGKTSLANIIKPIIHAFDNKDPKQTQRIVVKTNGHKGDTFGTIWRRLLDEITWEHDRPSIGLIPGRKVVTTLQLFNVENDSGLGPDEVRRIISHIPGSVFIIDEFDRVVSEEAHSFTDFIKALSDFEVDTTIVLVGVSETIDQLIEDHASIGRAHTQIMLPRMKSDELREILKKAEEALSICFSVEASTLIVHISQGLPHYTHLLGSHAVRTAADRWSRKIERQDVFMALKEAVGRAEQSVTTTHSKAVHSAHKDALYRHVLLAAGVAAAQTHDPLGYFNPNALREPLSIILKREVEIATFNNHLSEFSTKRGEVLERDGEPRSYRFRFRDPLLVPFVFMDAIATGLIDDDRLSRMLGASF